MKGNHTSCYYYVSNYSQYKEHYNIIKNSRTKYYLCLNSLEFSQILQYTRLNTNTCSTECSAYKEMDTHNCIRKKVKACKISQYKRCYNTAQSYQKRGKTHPYHITNVCLQSNFKEKDYYTKSCKEIYKGVISQWSKKFPTCKIGQISDNNTEYQFSQYWRLSHFLKYPTANLRRYKYNDYTK